MEKYIYFAKEDKDKMLKFIDMLTDFSYSMNDSYFDIHVKPDDCGAWVVEWEQTNWSHEYGGQFELVDEDEVVCKEVCNENGECSYVPLR